MDLEKIKKIEQSIDNLKNKTSRLFFLVQDTKGNAKASVRYIYQVAKCLKDNNYNVTIIHEKNEYHGVSEWLGEDYMKINHQSIEGQNLQVSPEDFIIIPEIYGHVMEQVANISCGKIVLSQSYDYILETLKPGSSWAEFNFLKCVTTSEEQKDYLLNLMKNVSVDVVEPLIPEEFSQKELPSKPIVSIHTRDQRDTMKVIKTFYLKYPQYRWITFRDMRGLTQKEFSEYLKDSFVSIWIDDISGFGCYPVESMLVGTPVIGKVPNLNQSWINEENGIWTNQVNTIPDILAEFIQNWLEDNINSNLYKKMKEFTTKYQDKNRFEDSVISTFNNYMDSRLSNMQTQLDKIKELEEIEK